MHAYTSIITFHFIAVDGLGIAKMNHQPDFIYLAALRLDKMTMTYK